MRSRSPRPSTGAAPAGLAAYAAAQSARMTQQGFLAVDLEIVKQHRLGLLADDVEVESRSSLDPPDAGVLSGVTAVALGQLATRADGLGEELRALADALARWVGATLATDGEVGLGLDLVMAGVLAP